MVTHVEVRLHLQFIFRIGGVIAAEGQILLLEARADQESACATIASVHAAVRALLAFGQKNSPRLL
jgi:hypothetical protein